MLWCSHFTALSQEMKIVNIMPCNLEIASVGKDTSRKTLQPCWKGPSPVLLTSPCATELQGTDSWIHVTCKESTKPHWTCTASGDLELKQATSDKTTLPRYPDQAC